MRLLRTATAALLIRGLGRLVSELAIDYLCVPACVGSALLSAHVWTDFTGQVDHDHKPVVVSFSVRCKAAPTESRLNCDFDFLRTAAGGRAPSAVYQSLPPIPWELDVRYHP